MKLNVSEENRLNDKITVRASEQRNMSPEINFEKTVRLNSFQKPQLQSVLVFFMLHFCGRKIGKGPRTIMLQIYVGSARDLSAQNNQNTKTARLILRKKIDFARHQHDRNR